MPDRNRFTHNCQNQGSLINKIKNLEVPHSEIEKENKYNANVKNES